MLTTIVAVFLLGLVLISFELILPGGILGLLGAVAIIGSWTLVFMHYGVQAGVAAVLGGFLILFVTLAVELKLLPRTKAGRKLFLFGSIQSTSQNPIATSDIVGKECEALTRLAPTGVVSIENKSYEAFSISGFVDKGARLQVVDFDNFRVRVRKM